MNKLAEAPRQWKKRVFEPIVITSLNLERIKDRTPKTLGLSCPDASCPADSCRNRDTQPGMNSCGPSCPQTCPRTCMYCAPKR